MSERAPGLPSPQQGGTSFDDPLASFSSLSSTPVEALAAIQAARALCPVAHSEEHGGFHILLRYEDVKGAAFERLRG